MIQIQRLAKLHGIALTRKCALLLEGIERELFELDRNPGTGQSTKIKLVSYLHDLAEFLVASPESSPEIVVAARSFLETADIAGPSGNPDTQTARLGFLRAVNDFRHLLMRISGQAPADWDLRDYLSKAPSGSSDETPARRQFLPGLKVYLEDIRSPFNVGTILRTAEALGFEEVLLSPDCADPRHPRAARSSMGAVDMIPWRRCALGELSPP
ncbi:MAG TPA: TrmH family RNA methyltransferase, partial [Rectinemataceae bacterium]|nr:TrmH family RNA methyltransferase [Rectinemataceae bacterium]